MRPELRNSADRVAGRFGLAVTLGCVFLVLLIAAGLMVKSWPLLATVPLGRLLGSSAWQPLRGQFGFFPFLMGTLWVTGVAVILAVPVSILASLYLSEYASRLARAWISLLVDVLAGIPSVVYGVWGILVIVPLIKDHLAPRLGVFSSGYTVLAAGIVLAVMILPVMIHVCTEIFRAVPLELRQASLALGATRWETISRVLLRKAMPGVIAAAVLGLSRAFGETMAVLMVAGNVVRVPRTPLDPAYPLPALIANNYGEMLSIPRYDAALMLAALLLFALVLLFTVAARTVLLRVERSVQ